MPSDAARRPRRIGESEPKVQTTLEAMAQEIERHAERVESGRRPRAPA